MIVGPVSNARSRDLSFHLCLYFLCFHCDYEIQSYRDESTHEKFLSFAPRKSVCSEALQSFSVHEYLSLSCSCTATHGKWQPYCTRSNACQPAHSHYRGNVRKKLRLRCSSVSNVHTLRHDKRFALRYREKCTSK